MHADIPMLADAVTGRAEAPSLQRMYRAGLNGAGRMLHIR